MSEDLKPDLTYTCPHCGQTAVLGSHFCQTVEVPPSSPGPGARRPRRLLASGVTALVAGLVLWRWLGPASLFVAAVVFLVLASWKAKR